MNGRSVRGAMRRHLARLAVTTACCLGGCTTTAPTVTIPFTLTAAGNVSIRAALNGRDQVDLMFHTAVDSVSLTEAAIAKLMTFTSDGSIVVNSWGGSNQARHSSGNSLRIGALEFEDCGRFIVTDADEIIIPFSRLKIALMAVGAIDPRERLTGREKQVTLFDPTTGRLVRTLSARGEVLALAFTP